MANEEHVAILKQGVEVWNKWRREHPDVEPDLGKAHLINADLRDADLRSANLRSANLFSAKFRRADLNHADLSHADLYGADLFSADLRNADLSNADLRNADLTFANLTFANLGGVVFGFTNFIDTNLEGTIGLDTCRHYIQSNIDHRTVAQSSDLPLSFLQGCGLPDWLIEAYKLTKEELTDHQITDITYRIYEIRAQGSLQFHSCFISYSSKNEDFARKLHDDLQAQGVRCWFDKEDLKTGDKIRDVIDDAIRLHNKVLLILSKDSIKSDWVEDEVEAALERERKRRPKETVLYPIRIDDAIMRTRKAWVSKLRRQRHIGDFCSWDKEDRYREAFERLLRDLRAS